MKKKYEVIRKLSNEYVLELEAESEEQACQLAREVPLDVWTDIGGDSEIEATEIE